MSIDYNLIFKEKTTPRKFREWASFWDLGELSFTDKEITYCINKLNLKLYEKSNIKTLVVNSEDRLADLRNYIIDEESLSGTKLIEYTLKFEKSWSSFKSQILCDEDDYFGELFKMLNQNKKNGMVLCDLEGNFRYWLNGAVAFDAEMKPSLIIKRDE